MLIDNRIDGKHPSQHAHNIQLLFVQRIAVEDAIVCLGMGHESRIVEGGDGVAMRNTGSNDLAATRISCHEMRLHQARRDLEVSGNKTSIKFDTGAATSDSQIHMIIVIAREMVLDAEILQHPGVPHQLLQFPTFIGSVQAGGDQHADLVLGDARIQELLQDDREQQSVGDWPGDITNQYAGT